MRILPWANDNALLPFLCRRYAAFPAVLLATYLHFMGDLPFPLHDVALTILNSFLTEDRAIISQYFRVAVRMDGSEVVADLDNFALCSAVILLLGPHPGGDGAQDFEALAVNGFVLPTDADRGAWIPRHGSRCHRTNEGICLESGWRGRD